ncbi:MAG TPA: pilus assembly protein TadG-related protein, partial [Anaerolineae bacterium]|nr:pilus assembly protein TadG-related protein [Anaerolineae bacterium]
MKSFHLQFSKEEEGQSVVIIALALVALMALMALVVDAGNAYAERRKMQNAVDAGAQAGAVMMGLNKKIGNNGTPDTINYAIRDYVQRNGVDPNRVKWYFVTQNSSGVRSVDYAHDNVYWTTNFSNSYAPDCLPSGTKPLCSGGDPVVGVQVEGNKQFATYFARVIGWQQMQVGAGSAYYAAGGACGASNLFPLALSDSVFDDTNNDGLKDIIFEDGQPTYTYPIVEKTTQPRRYAYVTWNPADTSVSTLVGYMNQTTDTLSPSGLWTKGQSIKRVSTSLYGSSSLYNELNSAAHKDPHTVTVPVYDSTQPDGSQVTIIGFARMKIITVNKGTGPGEGILNVKFEHFVDATGGGGCPNFGVQPPTTSQCPSGSCERDLVGSVKIRKLNRTDTPITSAHIPVDVINVLDISGSMNDGFGGTSKIQAAKTALTNFNNNMQPALGDKVALVTFPDINSGNTYNYTCTQSHSTNQYYTGEVRSALTNNVSSVNSIISGLTANGGTPIADGIRQGRLTVLGAGHVADHVAVLILASDGIANIR